MKIVKDHSLLIQILQISMAHFFNLNKFSFLFLNTTINFASKDQLRASPQRFQISKNSQPLHKASQPIFKVTKMRTFNIT